jgi:hypothetical protein
MRLFCQRTLALAKDLQQFSPRSLDVRSRLACCRTLWRCYCDPWFAKANAVEDLLSCRWRGLSGKAEFIAIDCKDAMQHGQTTLICGNFIALEIIAKNITS